MLATLAAPPSRTSRRSLAEQNDGRFLADSLGVAPGVAIEDQVAQDEHPRTAQVLDEINQMVRHGRIPLRHSRGSAASIGKQSGSGDQPDGYFFSGLRREPGCVRLAEIYRLTRAE